MRHQSILNVAWRVLVVISLLALAVSWTAMPAQAAPVVRKATLTATTAGGNIIISGSGFEPKLMYYINARAGKSANVRLGYLVANTKGDIKKQVPIPQKLLKYKSFDVCVRNARSGQAKCVKVN
jgi:hypothetical protein